MNNTKHYLFQSMKSLDQDERGADTVEWIAILAGLVLLLLVISPLFQAGGVTVGEETVNSITCWTQRWTGGSSCANGDESVAQSQEPEQPQVQEQTEDDTVVTGGSFGTGLSVAEDQDILIPELGPPITQPDVLVPESDPQPTVSERGGNPTASADDTLVNVSIGGLDISLSDEAFDDPLGQAADAIVDYFKDIGELLATGADLIEGGGRWLFDQIPGVNVEQNWGRVGEIREALETIIETCRSAGSVQGCLVEVLEPFIADCTSQVIYCGVSTLLNAATGRASTQILQRLDNFAPSHRRPGNGSDNDNTLAEADPENPRNRNSIDCDLNSFSYNTLVATAAGFAPIGELRVGDQVLAYNEATGKAGPYPVTATMVHLDPEIVMLTIDGDLIETTPEHPFYVMARAPWLAEGQTVGHWTNAEDLDVGDDVRRIDGSAGAVESVEVVFADQWMYNLTVDVAHTFFVGHGGWLVHNENTEPDFADYEQARNAALEWLEERGFKAEVPVYNRFPTNQRGTEVIGYRTAEGNVGFRVEYDSRNGAHINVFAGKEKGPHFTFDGDADTVRQIVRRLGCR